MIWIVGAGLMAREYAKVLKALNKEFICIGRSEKSAKEFEEATGVKPFVGGLENYLQTSPACPEYAINCVRAFELGSSNVLLIKYGVKNVLTEKPGLFPSEVSVVQEAIKNSSSRVFVAYNRRYYSSVLAAEKIIEDDGGLLSFNFEFTEWAHVIENLPTLPVIEKNNLFFTNSTHVLDLAFFIGGNPIEMCSFSKDECSWHKPVNFAGAGRTDKNVLFCYQANWNAPGRWAVEFLTAKHRIYLKPMEQLQLQDKGTVKIYPVEIDDHLDKEFKPGFYLETKAFLEGSTERLCRLDEQIIHLTHTYEKILGRK